MADSVPPPLDAATRAALERLADIATPAPVSSAPQTWGWAALALVLLAVAAWACWRWLRRRRANRYRRQALAELTKLAAALDDASTRPQALASIPPLVKRVALAAWPRSEVASLCGTRWVDFLRRQAAANAFPDAAARLLDDTEYRSRDDLAAVTAEDAKACLRAVRVWIETHEAPLANPPFADPPSTG